MSDNHQSTIPAEVQQNRFDNSIGDAPKIAVTYRQIADLQPSPNNPRLHSSQQIRQLKRSISDFGFNIPVVVDESNRVICGHGRLQAALELGFATVPTIGVRHLTERQKKAFAIADNKLSELSEFDQRLLADQLRELSLDVEFDLEATGFQIAEIDIILDERSENNTQIDPADALPPNAADRPANRVGDVWQLGRHRLLCDSSLNPNAFCRLMDGELAAAVITDPPFNVRVDGHVSGLGEQKHREFAMASGEMTSHAFRDFLTQVTRLFARHSVDGSLHYLFMDWRHLSEALAAGAESYTELKNICVWSKHNAGMGSFYRSQHELVLLYKNGRAPHRNNVQLGRFGRSRSNVWNYPGANNFGRDHGEDGDLLKQHPTVKPVAMIADAIMDCTARGELVVDGFVGSGTTVIAAEKVGRRCYGLEIDPLYMDLTIRRWQRYTGDQARHLVTGLTFDQAAAERGVQQ